MKNLNLPNIRKNEIYDATISGVTAEGNGVAKIDGFTVFVPNSANGDVAKIKIVKVLKNYGFGIIESLTIPSPERVQNDCTVFKSCGGCSFRHISYDSELKIKWQLVKDSFERIGKISLDPKEIIGSEEICEYRNKAQFPVGIDDNRRAVAGFYAKRSHRIVPCSDCLLQPAIFGEIVSAILFFINQNKIAPYDEITHKGTVRHIYLRTAPATGEIMVCIVSATKALPKVAQLCKMLTAKFAQIKSIVLNYNPKIGNVILGNDCKTLWGQDYITDILCGVKVQISALSFYQVNSKQAEHLYRKTIEYASLTNEDILLDLYCGIGTIGLSAAHLVKRLIGVEIIPQAIENANRNAALNGFENATFICDDCKGSVKTLEQDGVRPDVIFVDPPRKGCDPDVIDSIVKLAPKRIVMISCNPATAARDSQLLIERGFALEDYTPVDLFPRTGHVECVCLLTKNK